MLGCRRGSRGCVTEIDAVCGVLRSFLDVEVVFRVRYAFAIVVFGILLQIITTYILVLK